MLLLSAVAMSDVLPLLPPSGEAGVMDTVTGTARQAAGYVQDTAHAALETVKGATGVGGGATTYHNNGGGLLGTGRGLVASAQNTVSQATGAVSHQLTGERQAPFARNTVSLAAADRWKAGPLCLDFFEPGSS